MSDSPLFIAELVSLISPCCRRLGRVGMLRGEVIGSRHLDKSRTWWGLLLSHNHSCNQQGKSNHQEHISQNFDFDQRQIAAHLGRYLHYLLLHMNLPDHDINAQIGLRFVNYDLAFHLPWHQRTSNVRPLRNAPSCQIVVDFARH